MTWEHISEPLGRAISSMANAYVKGPTMFDKSQLPDIAEREAAYLLHKVYEEAGDAVFAAEEDTSIPDETLALLEAKAKEAEAAFEAAGVDLATDHIGNAILCAVSGAPILADDECLEDAETGEMVLRVAVGLGPRPVEVDESILPSLEVA